jgi:two-component system, OmpR family, copper resistance phosphate regulon response regulator CusR
MLLLVAEDHPSMARSLVNGLREEGFAVDLATTGTDALHLAVTAPYDCVILDMMLPGMDGWTVLRSLRRRGGDSAVLCLTARDGVEDRVRGLDLGADDYMVKPFAWAELVARVRCLVRRGHGKRSATLRIDDLEIDMARKAVSRDGRRIQLSAREYALLEYLALRQGEVVSRSDIWAHLYDQNDEAESNVVDVYIGYLRSKLDRNAPRKLIHTRRGLGYVLSADA